MIYTSYTNLSNEELLRLCQTKRAYSGIIEELCIRLEEAINSLSPEVSFPVNIDCPVCKVKLSLNDEGGLINVCILGEPA